jgi:hypothetical protein
LIKLSGDADDLLQDDQEGFYLKIHKDNYSPMTCLCLKATFLIFLWEKCDMTLGNKEMTGQKGTQVHILILLAI